MHRALSQSAQRKSAPWLGRCPSMCNQQQKQLSASELAFQTGLGSAVGQGRCDTFRSLNTNSGKCKDLRQTKHLGIWKLKSLFPLGHSAR